MGTALITGASSGLGLEFAWQLAANRHDVVLVARNEDKLSRVAEQIEAVAGVRAEVLPADLSTLEGADIVATRLRQRQRPIGLLVNNAGYATGTPIIDNDLGAELDMLNVMVTAVLVLSHEAANAMRRRGRGAILNVSSVAALTATGSYSAHKAWVRTFTEALATELKGTGVTATALCPGLVHTDFHRRAGWASDRYPEIAWLNPDLVVRQALIDVARGRVLSTPSLRYAIVSQLAQHSPRWLMRAIPVSR